ncbi:CHAT domain-containing protein [Streptomyces sp. NPDC020800]|uniref:CHAT domain-containing protein n=1 Tax=Streptomyces sp. NPDC020800 TaxID=3365092 RepID=UPI0037ABBA5C
MSDSMQQLWNRGRELINAGTEAALNEGIEALTEVLVLVTGSPRQALAHCDLTIGHWRLTQLGHSQHVGPAADHALAACQADIGYLLQGLAGDLERYMGLLEQVVSQAGIDLARLRAAQSFLDRYEAVLRGFSAYVYLQLAVADGYFTWIDSTCVRPEHADEARSVFDRAMKVLTERDEPSPDLVARALIHRSFLELRCARGASAFHKALDLAFAAEDTRWEGFTAGRSVRARIVSCLSRSRQMDLAPPDQWRLRVRLWERWADDWVPMLVSPERDTTQPPVCDWLEDLLGLEMQDFDGTVSLPAQKPLPLEVRTHATDLVVFGGYPPALVLALVSYRCGGVGVSLREALDPAWQDTVGDPSRLVATVELLRRIRDLVIDRQRGREAALADLITLHQTLREEDATRSAGHFFWACKQFAADAVRSGQFDAVTTFMYDLAQRVPEKARLAMLIDGWQTIKRFEAREAHHRIAARWTREIARLAEQQPHSDDTFTPAYSMLWASIQEAKVRASVESGSMDDLVNRLARKVQEHRSVNRTEAVLLEFDLIRLRVITAQKRGDAHTCLTELARSVRLMVEHPGLDFGSRAVVAANLIAVVSAGLVTDAQPFAHEVATAARMVFADLDDVVELGEFGVSVLAALTDRSIAALADVDAEQMRLASATVRTRMADGAIETGFHPVARLGARERSLRETLGLCAALDGAGSQQHAVLTLLEWLLAHVDRPARDHRTRVHHSLVAAALEQHVRADEAHFPRPMAALARYVAGESARHAGLRDAARHHLALALEDARTHPQTPIPADVIECDYAVLMVQSAADEGDQAEAMHWLNVLLRNPLAHDELAGVQLAAAVTAIAHRFGPEHVVHEADVARHALRLTASAEIHPDMDMALRVPLCEATLAVAMGDTRGICAALPVLDKLASQSSPAVEAYIRQTRVSALMRIGDIDRTRVELDRLTFLQDAAIGTTDCVDAFTHVDYFGTAQLQVAAAAADADDIRSAVEVVEQGRLRLLRRLRLGIREEGAFSASAAEPTSLWEDLAAFAEHDRVARFSVAQADWDHLFQDVTLGDALQAAERLGVVCYQLVHQQNLRMLYLVHGNLTFTTGPYPVSGMTVSSRENGHLMLALSTSWGTALNTCTQQGLAPADLRPVLVSSGERPDLTVLNDLAYNIAAGIELNESRVLNHLPSVRLARPRPAAEKPPAGPVRVLHAGDASSTLIGPWLEAAGLLEAPGLLVHSLMGPDANSEQFTRHLANATIIVASCHGSSDRSLLGSSLMVGNDGLTVLDVVGRQSLAHIDMLFLASCEMGRRLHEHHERESIAFSNAALVAGCRHVVAPVLPVNDLMSALVVDEFCRRLSAEGSLRAYEGAMATVAAMSVSDFQDRLRMMWARLVQSPLADRLPWPVKSAARVFEHSLLCSFPTDVRLPPFCISSADG